MTLDRDTGEKEDCKSFGALQLKKWNRNSIKNEEKELRIDTEEGRGKET
jgi:hypothetical protein